MQFWQTDNVMESLRRFDVGGGFTLPAVRRGNTDQSEILRFPESDGLRRSPEFGPRGVYPERQSEILRSAQNDKRRAQDDKRRAQDDSEWLGMTREGLRMTREGLRMTSEGLRMTGEGLRMTANGSE